MARTGTLPAGLELASWGSRVGAALLDGIVVGVASLVAFAPGVLFITLTSLTALGIILEVLGVIAAIAIYVLYASYFMQRDGEHNGQTLGKQWVGIRVIFPDGRRFGWGQSLLREFVVKQLLVGFASVIASTVTFFLAGIGGIVPPALDALWPLWDDENRAVHDLIVNTRVVRA